MRAMRRSLLTLAVLAVAASTARASAQGADSATRAAGAVADDLTAEDMAVAEEIGPGARIRIPPPLPDPPLTSAMLEDSLRAAQPEMEACGGASGVPRGSVRARVSRDGALTLRVRIRPADAAIERCLDTAARRHLVALLSSHGVARAVRATVRFGRGGTGPPRPPPPLPPPPGPVDEAIVHQRLDIATSALRRCLADAAPGVVGTVTLRVHARSDGFLVLEGVSMPPGVTAGPALVCMGDVVGRVRVPAGGGERDVSHPMTLGR